MSILPRPCRRRTAASVRFLPCPLQPPSEDWHALDRLLPADDLARVILAGINRFDPAGLWALYAGRGSPAYPPQRLLAVAVYEIRQGHTSPAQWARHARKVDSLRWLLAGFSPSRSCWYAFRDRAGRLLDRLNQELLHQLDGDGLVPGRRGTLDGTLIAANATRHRLANRGTLLRRLGLLDAAVAADAAGPDTGKPPAGPDREPGRPAPPPAVAAGPDREPGRPAAAPAVAAAPPGWMARTPSGRRRQRQGYLRARDRMDQLQAENSRRKKSKRRPADKLVVSLSDPEAAPGWDKQGVFRPLYNVQLLNDVDSPFVLGYQVVAQVNDAGLMGGMLRRQRQMLGRQVEDVLADSGYTAGADLQAAAAARVTVYAPWQANDHTTATRKGGKKIPKAEFTYLPEEDVYRCPEGKPLGRVGRQTQARQTSGKVTLQMYQAREEDCRGCRRRPECTRSGTGGRTVSRSEYDGLIEALRGRMQGAAGKGLYRLRRQSGERLNADFKAHRKLRAFSGRGLRRVSGEVALVVFANNLVTGEAERAKKAAPLTHSPEIGMPQEYRLL